MFDINWAGSLKRAGILFGAIWASNFDVVKNLIAKIVPVDDSDFGGDDIARAVLYSLSVEVVMYGRNVQLMRVLKRAALIAAAIYGSFSTPYAKLKVSVAKAGTGLGSGGAAAAGMALDALFASLAVEIGQDLF